METPVFSTKTTSESVSERLSVAGTRMSILEQHVRQNVAQLREDCNSAFKKTGEVITKMNGEIQTMKLQMALLNRRVAELSAPIVVPQVQTFAPRVGTGVPVVAGQANPVIPSPARRVVSTDVTKVTKANRIVQKRAIGKHLRVMRGVQGYSRCYSSHDILSWSVEALQEYIRECVEMSVAVSGVYEMPDWHKTLEDVSAVRDGVLGCVMTQYRVACARKVNVQSHGHMWRCVCGVCEVVMNRQGRRNHARTESHREALKFHEREEVVADVMDEETEEEPEGLEEKLGEMEVISSKVHGQMLRSIGRAFLPAETDETVSQVGDAAKEIKETAAEVKATVTRSEEKIESAANALEELASISKMFKEFFSTNVSEKLKSLMSPEVMLKYISKLTGLAIAVWVVYRIDDKTLQVAIISSALLSSGIAYEAISGFINTVVRMASASKAKVVGQSYGDEKKDDEVAEGALDSFVTILKNMFRKITPKEASATTKRWSLMRAYAGVLKFTKDSALTVFEYMKYACYVLYEMWTGHPYVPDEMKDLYQQITVWLSESLKIMHKDIDLGEVVTREKVKRLLWTGEQVELNVQARQMVNSTVPIFMDTMRRLREVYKLVLKREKVDIGRIKPIFAQVVGEANTGKSIFANYLAKDLFAAVNDRKIESSDQYNFDFSEEKFWEGYDRQWYMLMDDFMQSPVEDDRRFILLTLIRCCNDAPFNVPMAFESKGGMSFTSRFIVATCNETSMPGAIDVKTLSSGKRVTIKRDGVKPYIQDPLAFATRRDFLWKLKNVNVDPNMKGRGMKAEEFTPDIYLIEELDPISEKPTGQTYTYPQALKLLINAYIVNEQTVGNAQQIIFKQEPSEEVAAIIRAGKEKLANARVRVVNPGKAESDVDDDEFHDVSGQADDDETIKVDKEMKLEEMLQDVSKVASAHMKTLSEKEKQKFLLMQKDEIDEDLQKSLDAEMVTYLKRLRAGAGQLTTISPTAEDDLSKIKNPYLRHFISAKRMVMDAVKTCLKALAGVVAEGLSLGAQMCLAFAGAFAGLIAINKFVTWMNWVPKPEEVSGQSGPVAIKTAARGKKLAGPGKGSWKVRGQSSPNVDPMAMDLIQNVLVKNICKVKTVNGSVHGTFILGKYFITAKHVWVNNNEKFELTFLDGSKYMIEPEERIISMNEIEDQSVVKIVKKGFPDRKNILHLIVKDEDFEEIASNAVALVSPYRDEKTQTVMMETRIISRAPSQLIEMKYRASRKSDYIAHNTHTLTFEGMMTKDGECGLPYILINSRTPRKIFGIHVAGGAYACCSLISQESLKDILESDEVAGQMAINGIEILPVERSVLDYKEFECSNVEIVGTVAPNLTINQPGKSAKAASQIAGLFHTPVSEAPALLKPIKGISPMQVALRKKLMRPRNNHSDERADMVADHLLAMMPDYVEPRMLTMYEAINGVAGWHHFKQMEMDTSPGWPYNTSKKQLRGKKDWMTSLDQPDGSKVYLPIQELELKVQLLLDDIADVSEKLKYEVIYADCLKDEILPMKKVWCYYTPDLKEIDWSDEKWKEGAWNKEKELRSGPWIDVERKPVGDTRIMGPAPLEVLIVERMLFGAFFENLLRWQPETSCPFDLGINPHKAGSWKKVYKKTAHWFDPDTVTALAGDVKKMDASLTEFLQMWSCDFILAWYIRGGMSLEWARGARKFFKATCVEVLHLAINLLYRTTGNPSGKFLTTIINSLVMYLLIQLTGLNHLDRVPQSSFQEALDVVHGVTSIFGDDHVVGNRGLWFTMVDLREECAKFGLEYTGIFKDKEMPELYKLAEVKYLQRYFLTLEDGEVHGALDMSTIETITDWYTTSQSEAAALLQSGHSALEECFHWGHVVFEKFKEKLNRALSSKGLPCVRTKWRDLHASYYEFYLKSEGKKEEDLTDVIGQCDDTDVLLFDVNNCVYSYMVFGQSDIADVTKEITDAPTTVTPTTAFTDNAGKVDAMVETPVVKTELAAPLNPYADQGLTQVLSRPYPVGTISWSSTQPTGTMLWDGYFPSLLTGLPNISEKLNRFQYGRFPVKVRFVLQGLLTMQGRVRFVRLTNWSGDTAIGTTGGINPMNSFWSAANLPSVDISANTSVTGEMMIPWVGPLHYWNMKDDDTVSSSARGITGYTAAYVYHPLRLAGASGPVAATILVYAEFVDPEIAGYGYRVSSLSKSAKELERIKKILEVHGQSDSSDSLDREQLSRSMAGVNTNLAKAKTHAKATTDSFSFSDMMSKVGSGAQEALGGMLAQSLFLDKPLDVSVTSRVTERAATSFAVASGTDGADILAMHVDNHVATDPNVYVQPVDYNLASEYVKLPSVIYNTNFDDATEMDTRIIDVPVNPMYMHSEAAGAGGTHNKFYPTYLSNWTKEFVFWTGSIKYLLIFSCSSITSARVRIAWVPDPTYTAALVSDEDGDVVNKVFDIKGDTSVEITIPFLREKGWLPVSHPNAVFPPVTNWDLHNGQLIVSVKIPPSCGQPDATPVIDVSLEISGGEDYRCAKPTFLAPSLTTTPPAETSVTGQMDSQNKLTAVADVRERFRSPFPGLIPAGSCVQHGVVMGEEVQSWPELMKRYSQFNSTTTYDQVGVDQLNPWSLLFSDCSKWGYHKKCWLFHRGSLRFKAVCASTNARFLFYWSNNDSKPGGTLLENTTVLDTNRQSCLGLAAFDSNLSLISEVQVPFYFDCNMISNGSQLGRERLPNVGYLVDGMDPELTAVFKLFISVGDDYTAGCPIPPPPLYCPVIVPPKHVSDKPTTVVGNLGKAGMTQISLRDTAMNKLRGNKNSNV